MTDFVEGTAPATYGIPSSLSFPVVGIGASAGGLTALRTFLQQMPSKSGMSFVVVVHLSPKHESNIDAVLQKSTRMPVRQITQPTMIEPDHIYVISPQNDLTMIDGMLHVEKSNRPRGRHIAVDIFFRTLADAHRDRALGIVLSGSGGDGAAGIARIKEQGGVAIAQHPDDSEYSDMPLNAIATGKVDFVLPVAEIPDKLIEIWSNARAIALPAVEGKALIPTPPDTTPQAEQALGEILEILRVRSGNDFRHYKRATVLRRIERRLQVNVLKDLPRYRDFLKDHPDEAKALLADMLISVTNFFRDRESFETLERDYLDTVFSGTDEMVRVWVPGCATGEEAYSLAMLLAEKTSELDRVDQYQIFASDIDERAIAFARAGTYPGSIITDIVPGRLRLHFSKRGERYQINKLIRDRVLFALHNVLRDPPFSRIDLISCRNLLIYLDRQVHERIFELFYFSLRPGGLLFLGSSESADSGAQYFEVVDKKARIYRARQLVHTKRPMSLLPDRSRNLSQGLVPANESRNGETTLAELHQRALEHYAPPSVIVNPHYDIIHLSNNVGRFLRYEGGEPSRKLLSVVIPELRAELRTTLFQCAHGGRSVEARRVCLKREGKSTYVNMIARPFQDGSAGSQFILVLFDEVEDSLATDAAGTADGGRDKVIERLEEDLRRANDRLQSTIEQSETSNEELKASNEELQAINEELRSASEELETSKEELQSLNEELLTVNHELKMKVDETAKINDDLQNFIVSADIATLFVDSDLRIKRFTPRAVELFNLIPADIGRVLFDITHRLDYSALAADTKAAFESLQLREREIRTLDGKHYLVRILPYRTLENRIDGAVLTFFDTSHLHQLRAEETGAKRIIPGAPYVPGFRSEEDRRRQHQADIEDALRLKDDFIAVVSHELKNPLNLISINAEILARSAAVRAASNLEQTVASIRSAVRSQVKIIDDLLDMSRIRTGKLLLEFEPVDLNDVVQAISAIVGADASASELNLDVSLCLERAVVRGDRSRVEQIVWNLLSNAIKFTPRGGRVAVNISRDANCLKLSVADTGQGIDAHYIGRIFDLFGQAPGRTLRGRSGLGIGLNLVRQLVHHHGGRILVESEGIGRGATFTVWIPAYEEKIHTVHDAATSADALAGMRILFIDDAADAAEAMRLLLAMEGAHIETAGSGKDALARLATVDVDLIISDIGMPEMDGFEFVRRVRSDPRTSGVPVIALSGFARDMDVRSALAAGFDAHLSKPATVENVITVIKDVKRRRNAR
jgi:two-component system CheB/CheR fusion protein